MPTPWPHQTTGVEGVLAAFAAGYARVCLTSVTGMGKTEIVKELVRRDLGAGRRAVLYTNRRMLLDQSVSVFGDLNPGVRAAGVPGDRHRPFQIATVQTEHQRTVKSEVWDIFPADRVYFDEGHLMTGDTCARLVHRHDAAVKGLKVLYVTATPVGMGGTCDKLVVAGTTSEGRKCGALVPAIHYGPSEPFIPRKEQAALDRGEDLSENKVRSVMMRPGIFGFVLEWFRKLNPEGKPSILFAPGVGESLWFAEQFYNAGISAAHIDGEDVWINGREYKNDPKAREALADGSRGGEIKMVSNRYVLREGVNWPWLEHMIFAFVTGNIQTYLQVGGRGLRASPGTGKEKLIVQDHGGLWHKLGSLNADREWDLTLPPSALSGLRADRIREGKEKEPSLCPRCKMVLMRATCPCGFVIEPGKKSRPVMQENGELREVAGDVFVPKVREQKNDTTKKWVAVYFRCRNCGFTFRQAEALFYQDHGYWPPKNLKFMPCTPVGWFRRVIDVPMKDLYT